MQSAVRCGAETPTDVVVRLRGGGQVDAGEDAVLGGGPERVVQTALPGGRRHRGHLGRLVQQLGARALEQLVAVQLALSVTYQLCLQTFGIRNVWC